MSALDELLLLDGARRGQLVTGNDCHDRGMRAGKARILALAVPPAPQESRNHEAGPAREDGGVFTGPAREDGGEALLDPRHFAKRPRRLWRPTRRCCSRVDAAGQQLIDGRGRDRRDVAARDASSIAARLWQSAGPSRQVGHALLVDDGF
jgi:hypothetical protein